MYINSNFKDYYDLGLALGQDPFIVYNRKEVTISDENNDKFLNQFFKYNDFLSFKLKKYVLLFCGKIFYFVRLGHESYCFTIEQYENYLLKRDAELYYTELRNIYNEKKNYLFREYTKRNMQLYFNQTNKVINEKWVSVHRHYSSPIVLIDVYDGHYRVVLNKNLKSLNFVSMIDPYSAFQDISMFLSNYLIEIKETIEIDDISNLQKKGFDKKKSFRNMK